MPILGRRTAPAEKQPELAVAERPSAGGLGKRIAAGAKASLLENCANPNCASGWLHLWRSRSGPVFENGWNCSSACTAERLQQAIAREGDGRGANQARHRHRVPLGLLMMEKGWITAEQLKEALRGQRESGTGRIGEWLIGQKAVSEQQVTRALGLQWNCPVLSPDFHDAEAMTPLLPRLFVDAFGALPLRIAAGKLAYLGFEDRLDPVLAFAIERMTGLKVECGVVQSSAFRPAHNRMLKAKFPSVELVEAASEPALVRTLVRTIERAKPVDSRLVRVHDCLWLRMWCKPQGTGLPELDSVQDVVCTISQ